MKLKKLYYAAACMMVAFFAQTVSAQTTNYFWSGGGDGATWDQPANWSTGIVPVNDGTTFQIFIGTGFPTPTPTPIVISASDHIILQDQLFGPEWGETLNIYGSVNAGFGFAPIGAIGGPKSTVNFYGNGSYFSGDSIFIGDPFWFAGGPNVDFNLYNNSSIQAGFLIVGGHLNLYDNSMATVNTNKGGVIGGLLTGTPNAGQFGGLSSDATRWINLAGGKMSLPTGNIAYVDSLIARGIFFCYGKKYDTNEFTITDDGTNTVITVTNSLGILNTVSVQAGVSNMMVGTFQSAIAVGNFANLSAVPLSMIDAAQSGGGTIAYKSSNTNVASISNAGVITAIKTGTTLISVTYSNSTFGSFSGVNTVLITVTPLTNSLIHRYSFNESSGSTATDSVGGAAWNGTLNDGATLGGGSVTLDGSSGYVQLPAGIVSNMDAVTIEAWVNFGAPAPYAALFAFGNQDAAPTPAGMNYIMFQPFTGAVPPTAAALFGLGDPGSGNEQDAILPLVSGGVTNYLGNVQVVTVYHPYAGYVALYTNGVLAAINTGVTHPLASTLGADPLNYLGVSLYAADPFLNAAINEFRIYSGPLSAGQIAADYALGPNQLIGTNTNVRLFAALSGGNLLIRWPTNSALVNVMSSPALGSQAAWSATTGPLNVAGTNYQMTVPMNGSVQFFRLQQ